nr:uncharacterized protein LOC109174935 [Ipomoea batatas]
MAIPVEQVFANLTFADLEDGEGAVRQERVNVDDEAVDDEFYVVGRLVTDKPTRFAFFRDTMAGVWRPARGMNVRELLPQRYLFRFFLEKDVQRIMDDGPWSYEQTVLILKRRALQSWFEAFRAGNRRGVPTANQRWIAPESKAERKLWTGPELVNMNVETPNEESMEADEQNVGVENEGLRQPANFNSVPCPTVNPVSAAAMPNTYVSSSVAAADAGSTPHVEVMTGVSPAVGETVRMEVGSAAIPTVHDGGPVGSMVVAYNTLKRCRSHDNELAIPGGAGLSFPSWFQQVLTTMDDDAVTRCTAVLYAIWAARNSALWEFKVPRPTTMVALADKTLQNWRLSQVTSSSHGPLYAPGNVRTSQITSTKKRSRSGAEQVEAVAETMEKVADVVANVAHEVDKEAEDFKDRSSLVHNLDHFKQNLQ